MPNCFWAWKFRETLKLKSAQALGIGRETLLSLINACSRHEHQGYQVVHGCRILLDQTLRLRTLFDFENEALQGLKVQERVPMSFMNEKEPKVKILAEVKDCL